MSPSVQYRRKNSAITEVVFCGGPPHSADTLAQVEPQGAPTYLFSQVTEGERNVEHAIALTVKAVLIQQARDSRDVRRTV